MSEEAVAEIRWLREIKGQTYAAIALHFEGAFTERYIRSVCDYMVRPNIQPERPK